VFGFSLAAPIPAYEKACHYGQSSSTHESSYHLADDWDDVEAIQGWDHALEDFHTDNSAYNSRNRVLEWITVPKLLPSKSPTAKPPAIPATSQMMRDTVSGTTDPY
jgi:hypothetical protein